MFENVKAKVQSVRQVQEVVEHVVENRENIKHYAVGFAVGGLTVFVLTRKTEVNVTVHNHNHHIYKELGL